MNFQNLASTIAESEGLKKQTSIGNIREILKITLTELAKLPVSELGKLLSKYEK